MQFIILLTAHVSAGEQVAGLEPSHLMPASSSLHHLHLPGGALPWPLIDSPPASFQLQRRLGWSLAVPGAGRRWQSRCKTDRAQIPGRTACAAYHGASGLSSTEWRFQWDLCYTVGVRTKSDRHCHALRPMPVYYCGVFNPQNVFILKEEEIN